MKPRDRMLHALHHEEPDRVPTGENDIDYVLVERLLGRTTLYNSRWRERQALWEGRRGEIVRDYGTTLVDLARTLEWDYVRVPTMPVDCAGHLWYGAVWSRGLEYLLVAMRPDLGPRYRIQ